jgi:hypothetical protein
MTKDSTAGEEMKIASDDHGFASLAGVWRGRVQIGDDFDELPDDLAEALGMRS